ncbi:MAG: major capsid protein [Thermofilaceae archaeon]
MKRYKHNLSHYKLLTGNAGILYPVSHYEVLPGDTIQQSSSCLLRASPLLAPVMHRFHVRLHTFFVPYRLLWDGWEAFITGRSTSVDGAPILGNNVFDFTPMPDVEVGDLMDHLGVPPGDYPNQPPAYLWAWPLAAYNLIYNEYYRDQDLINEVEWNDLNLKRVAWGKDYFTSARPWPQKGAAVTLPLGGSAPITGSGAFSGASVSMQVAGAPKTAVTNPEQPVSSGRYPIAVQNGEDENNPVTWTASGSVSPGSFEADLSGATASDVRDIRVAFALQRYEEARAMYGSRYVEYLRYLGVRPSDARLQRPEYLGGGKRDISFSEVLQTAPGDNPIGSMYGHGISGMSTRRYRRFFEEHGIVMTLLSVRPQSIYTNGVYRSWLRRTKEDFFQKELQFVGQQEILNGEVYYTGVSANMDPFGYQDRYAEYTMVPSTIAGDFRTTLDFWHAARIFDSAPALNATFVQCDPTDRIFSVPSEDTLWITTQHRVAARRLVARNPSARII